MYVYFEKFDWKYFSFDLVTTTFENKFYDTRLLQLDLHTPTSFNAVFDFSRVNFNKIVRRKRR